VFVVSFFNPFGLREIQPADDADAFGHGTMHPRQFRVTGGLDQSQMKLLILPLRFRIGGRWAWGVLWLVAAFWLLRNIPAWPFSLLATPK